MKLCARVGNVMDGDRKKPKRFFFFLKADVYVGNK